MTMERLGYVLPVVAMLIMAEASNEVCKHCNRSYQILTSVNPSNPYYPRIRVPVSEDDIYLPEDNTKERKQEEERSHDRDNRDLPGYSSLCQIVTKQVRLDDSEYEYQPPHYHEVRCKNFYSLDNLLHAASPPTQRCVHPAFHCVQRSKNLFFVRRRWNSECWEPFVMQIASGCECMWPESSLGDISDHY